VSEQVAIRDAASVILVRPRGTELEVFLLCRHRKASFMPSAFVFPGGAADPGESDLRVTAARELREEAGVSIAPEELHYFAHWITPSIEKKRFSARFFLGRLPAGQEPHFDDQETVDQIWVTPAEGLARAGELRLPPPQVRTLWEMRDAAARGWDALVADAAARAAAPHPILPRMTPVPGGPGGFALLLPWDPDYERAGTGDARPIADGHPLAIGPSRFILEDGTWKNVAAPSPSAG
jgi:8-oxo-dGTP pyrophosphatase MutT (NUDIX family)